MVNSWIMYELMHPSSAPTVFATLFSMFCIVSGVRQHLHNVSISLANSCYISCVVLILFSWNAEVASCKFQEGNIPATSRLECTTSFVHETLLLWRNMMLTFLDKNCFLSLFIPVLNGTACGVKTCALPIKKCTFYKQMHSKNTSFKI